MSACCDLAPFFLSEDITNIARALLKLEKHTSQESADAATLTLNEITRSGWRFFGPAHPALIGELRGRFAVNVSELARI